MAELALRGMVQSGSAPIISPDPKYITNETNVKLFIVFVISLATAQAASSDKDALVAKYKNKFAVVLKDGISTCLHRSLREEIISLLRAYPKTLLGVRHSSVRTVKRLTPASVLHASWILCITAKS